MKLKLPKIKRNKFKFDKHVPVIVALVGFLALSFYISANKISNLQELVSSITSEKDKNFEELQKIGTELAELKEEDQLKRNDELQGTIGKIEATYKKAVSVYENLLELKAKSKDTAELDKLFSKILSDLSKRDYDTASASINELSAKISDEENKIAASFTIPESVPVANAPPGSGYSRQQVQTDAGTFMVSIIAADIGSTKVIVDTASDSNCGNDCPVLPLATYVSRNGAYAGVNGTYFCRRWV